MTRKVTTPVDVAVPYTKCYRQHFLLLAFQSSCTESQRYFICEYVVSGLLKLVEACRGSNRSGKGGEWAALAPRGASASPIPPKPHQHHHPPATGADDRDGEQRPPGFAARETLSFVLYEFGAH